MAQKRKPQRRKTRRKTASNRRPGNGGIHPPAASQFAPGNPGGPGRPKGNIITRLKELIEDGYEGKDLADLIAKKIAAEAARGDHRFAKMLLDRLYGLPAITIQGPEGGPIKLIHISTPDAV